MNATSYYSECISTIYFEIECSGSEQLVATVSFVAKSESSMKKIAGWFKSAEKKGKEINLMSRYIGMINPTFCVLKGVGIGALIFKLIIKYIGR